MSQNTDIVKVSESIEQAIRECGISGIAKLPKFLQAIRMAQGIAALRQALTDQFVQQALMPLQGTSLGFLTDQDTKGGYGLAVVRDCAIEAMLRGFNVVGNEFNIIAGRFYGTRNGFERLVAEFPGMRNLVLQPGVPVIGNEKGGLVPFTATWTLQGVDMRIDCQQTAAGDFRIPVKVNSGMGADAVIGKATRKMLYRIYQRINGSSYGLTDGEVSDQEPLITTGEPAPSPVPEGTPEGKRVKIGGKGKPAPAAEAQGEPKPAEPKAAEPKPQPKPANDVPISGPPAALGFAPVFKALGIADKAWANQDHLPTVMAWSQAQLRSAFDWAIAMADTSIEDDKIPPRPEHTRLERVPGEEG